MSVSHAAEQEAEPDAPTGRRRLLVDGARARVGPAPGVTGGLGGAALAWALYDLGNTSRAFADVAAASRVARCVLAIAATAGVVVLRRVPDDGAEAADAFAVSPGVAAARTSPAARAQGTGG